ncbi:MAG: DUF885 domain-containing protein [Chloroflexota bacterium]|nr:DUF885 domain-containing protein [Chloroflexota bacterium]
MPDAVLDRFESLAKDYRPTPHTRYEHALHAFLEDLFVAQPVVATQIGYHELDHRWPDLTGTARLARISMLRRHRGVVEGLAEEELSADERIDRAILVEAIDAMLFEEEVLRETTWDPLSYVRLLGSGFFALLARDYAPFVHRGRAFLIRMQGIPDVLAAARSNLLGLPSRPVSLLHTETALNQLDGVRELIDEAIAEAYRQRDPGEDLDLHGSLEHAAPAARQALDEFRRFLDTEVRTRAEGEGRLGPELYRDQLRHTLSSDISPDELVERARRDYEVVRTEMVRIARQLWPAWVPHEPMPTPSAAGSDADAEAETVRRVLEAISREHRQPHELIDYCRREVARIERFVRRNEMIGLPREPLSITWTPLFMRAYGGAFLDAPGPLDQGQSSYFWITPPGEDWPAERVESYLREDNDRMLRLLCIHEGIPGHYLQLSWSNRCPSLTRSVFASNAFAEGWAVYVTQVMMDVGYGRRDPALLLVHWKFYLRGVINAIIDVLVHTAEMTEQEAMDLMVRGGFQEEQEARQKWLRARLTSGQLSTYYLGSLEMWDLEVDARRRAAVASGASADDVPVQRVVGGLGDTPGFDYREHLESVISQGTPPIRWVRRILHGA